MVTTSLVENGKVVYTFNTGWKLKKNVNIFTPYGYYFVTAVKYTDGELYDSGGTAMVQRDENAVLELPYKEWHIKMMLIP